MEVNWTKNGMWYTDSFKELADRMELDFFSRMMYQDDKVTEQRKQQHQDNRVYAYIIVGKTRKLCWYDSDTGKAYKTDGYGKTWVEYPRFKFDRFCRMMDL